MYASLWRFRGDPVRLSASNSWREIGRPASEKDLHGRGLGVQTLYSRVPPPRSTIETDALPVTPLKPRFWLEVAR
jgi:hypothetical protein